MGIQSTGDFCVGLFDVIVLLRNVVSLLQWIIPLGLVLFGILDLGKAVIAGKEDEMKKAQGTLIKRVIYAIAIFLVITIVTFVTGLIGSPDWKTCWTDAADGKYDGTKDNINNKNDNVEDDCAVNPDAPGCN